MIEGNYKVKIQDWGVNTSSKGLPQVFVVFETPEGDHVTWRSGLDSTTIEGKWGPYSQLSMTMKTLKALGFKSQNVADIADTDALQMGREAEVLVTGYQGRDGKTYYSVKKVVTQNAHQDNSEGTGGAKKLTKKEIQAMLLTPKTVAKPQVTTVSEEIDSIFG